MLTRYLFSIFNSPFSGWLSLRYYPQHVEEPSRNVLKNSGVQGIDDVLALLFILHQPGFLEDTEVVGDGRPGEVEGCGNLPGGHIPPGQQAQDFPAGVIAQGLEEGV
ncbi:RNA-binding proteins [Moorella thermoacetica Y72]|uniref:RNA-binding proteins n=1 Tax=Moorella thermoacetica Y72 TaxID=1325331 RepID=A0A0S6UBW9_NEOTH|nr:RNA-binding proteins [Moorella thermoacetica Y72]